MKINTKKNIVKTFIIILVSLIVLPIPSYFIYKRYLYDPKDVHDYTSTSYEYSFTSSNKHYILYRAYEENKNGDIDLGNFQYEYMPFNNDSTFNTRLVKKEDYKKIDKFTTSNNENKYYIRFLIAGNKSIKYPTYYHMLEFYNLKPGFTFIKNDYEPLKIYFKDNFVGYMSLYMFKNIHYYLSFTFFHNNSNNEIVTIFKALN